MREYPKFFGSTVSDVITSLQFIIKERIKDVSDWNNLPNIFVSGRKVNKIPTSASDVVSSDKPGDINYDSNYIYILENIAGTATWKTAPLTNFAPGGTVAWGGITGVLSNQTDLQTALNAKQNTGNYITALTGDVAAAGPGSSAATLANTAVTPGNYTYGSFTVDAKGRITAASSGTTPVTSVGPTTPSSFTQGSVVFAGATTLSEDNTNFFWNNTLKKLNIGTNVAASNVLSVNQTAPGAQVVMAQFQSQFAFAAASVNQCLNFLTDDTGTNSTTSIVGINGIAQKSGASGTATSIVGVSGSARNTGGATATAVRGALFSIRSLGGSTTTTAYGVDINGPIVTGVGSTIGTCYGVRVAAQKATGVTTGFGLASDGVNDINYVEGSFRSGGILTSQSGRVVKTRSVTAAGAITVATTDYYVGVNKTVGAATAVNLPATPTTGTVFIIKDEKGDAAANNITVTPAAGNIDNAATFVMATNKQSIMVIYNGTQWTVN